MKPALPKSIVGLVLLVLVIACAVWSGHKPRRSRAQRDLQTNSKSAVVATVRTNFGSASGDTRVRRIDVGSATTWLERRTNSPSRDPFGFLSRPPVASARSHTTNDLRALVVTATWCQAGHRLAVINGQVVPEGAELDSYRVERIEAGAVLVQGPSGAERIAVPSFGGRPPSASTNDVSAGSPSSDGRRPRQPG